MTSKKVLLKDKTGDSRSFKRKRPSIDDDDKTACDMIKRAEEIQANLEPEFPSMIKYMVRSHVSGCFWLGLPMKFSSKHLPKHDTTMILEDEHGEEFQTIYLAAKSGLSGGWKGFSIAHNLQEGDVIVFQLIEHSKFKVYIVTRNRLDEFDGVLGLLQLDAPIKQMEENERDLIMTTRPEDNCLLEFPMENIKNESDSEVVDGIRLSETSIEFKDVKSIDDFTILANGLVINSELSKHLQAKYYELCRSQNSFLHDRILDGLNCRLVAGIIAETINIADAIRASKLTTSRDDFKIWEKTLKAFDDMGMKVGFLRARLKKLVNLPLVSKRIQETKLEKRCAEEEKKNIEGRILDLNRRIIKLDSEIKSLEMNSDKLELEFKESASAPW